MMRRVAAVLVVLAAVPAFAGGHRSAPKPASEQPVGAHGVATGGEKNTLHKSNNATSRNEKRLSPSEHQQGSSVSLKDLAHPSDEPDTSNISRKGNAKVGLDESGLKVKGGGAAPSGAAPSGAGRSKY